MAQYQHAKPDLSVLTLDGGGVRGLSSLHILAALMRRVNEFREKEGLDRVKPYQLFDLIAGTSTGGLIAIMLGRLYMDVEECIVAYQQLSKEVFDRPESLVGRAAAFASKSIKPKFSSAKLERQILGIVEERLGVEDPSNAPLRDPSFNCPCKVFVCATPKATTHATTLLRSYPSADLDEIESPTIVEAALATSAATSFFDEVEIGGEVFVDGALGANNPANEAFKEIQKIYGLSFAEAESRLACFTSIGTGHLGLNELTDNAWELVRETMVKIVTQTERTARDFEESHFTLFSSGRAFRFNVDHGLEAVGLDEWNQLGAIKAKTRNWLGYASHANEVGLCAKQLANNVGLLDQFFFWTKGLFYRRNASGWLVVITLLPVLVILVAFFARPEYREAVSNARFRERHDRTFEQQTLLDSSLPIFAVLGATGVGKSSFIRRAGGRHIISGESPIVGETLKSQTMNSQFYRFSSLSSDGYLIDTPGIDESDRTRTDMEIMQQIHNELDKLRLYDKMLMGLIFLYDISQPRAYGTVLNAMNSTADMIEHLLGRNGIAKVTLVTTKWTKNPTEETRQREELRERELRENHWDWQLKCNSRIERYDDTIRTALNIILDLETRSRPVRLGAERCQRFTPNPAPESKETFWKTLTRLPRPSRPFLSVCRSIASFAWRWAARAVTGFTCLILFVGMVQTRGAKGRALDVLVYVCIFVWWVSCFLGLDRRLLGWMYF